MIEKSLNFRLDEKSKAAVDILKAEGYQITAVIRRALVDKAKKVQKAQEGDKDDK